MTQIKEKECELYLTKTKLNYRFYNPNTEEDTIKYITKIFTEVSKTKFEKAIQKNAQNQIVSAKECPAY